jgi:hypothetical protein
MSVCSTAHKIRREAIVRPLQHAKGFAEDQVAHDVKCKPVTYLCHVLSRTPSVRGFGRMRTSRASRCPVKDCTAELVDFPNDVFFHTLDSIVSEAMRQNPTLAGMR